MSDGSANSHSPEIALRLHWVPGCPPDTPSAFTSTRAGGISRPPFDTLNMGTRVGDILDAVRENRRRFLRHIGSDPSRAVLGHQVHSANSSVVDSRHAGFGVIDPTTAIPDTDALITRTSGMTIGVLVADCVPVILYDPVTRTGATVHAGRRGALGGIVTKTITKLKNLYDSRPGDLFAIIGPSIRSCCYEVSTEIAEEFRARYGDGAAHGRYLDLPAAVCAELQEIGVRDDHVSLTDHCTSCRSDLFFSYRREGDPSGRMMTTLSLQNGTHPHPDADYATTKQLSVVIPRDVLHHDAGYRTMRNRSELLGNPAQKCGRPTHSRRRTARGAKKWTHVGVDPARARP